MLYDYQDYVQIILAYPSIFLGAVSLKYVMGHFNHVVWPPKYSSKLLSAE